MAGLIPDSVIEEIRQRSDIVEVISRYIALEKRGKNYLALCPFHQEKTPSFNINQERQIFHCFGCGVGGNVFKFLMMVEGLSFPEAVRTQGARIGIDVPEETSPKDNIQQAKKDRAFKVYGLVRDFYRFLLTKKVGSAAVKYIENRNLIDGTRENFELGYAPPGWDALTKYLTAKGISGEELTNLGLVHKRESGGYYDRFRNRIMFPIWDSQGRVVGFGGRTMGDDTPKYLNSPEGEFFKKGQLLYGLHIARKGIRELGYVVLMEGYMDVAATYQHGVTNAVASLGTAFTREQGKLLMNYTHDVVIAYDSDAAGSKAAIRSADILQDLGCQVRIATIIGAKDPDEYIQVHGLAGWQSVIEQAMPMVQYKLLQAAQKYGIQNPGTKQRILQEVLPNLASVASAIEFEETVKQTATVLQVNWETVLEEIKNYKKSFRKKPTIKDNFTKNSHNIPSVKNYLPSPLKDKRSLAEAGILRFAIENKNFLKPILQNLGQDFFQNSIYQKIFDVYLEKGYEDSVLMDELDDISQGVVSSLLVQEIPGENVDQILSDLINTIKKAREKAKLDELLIKLAAAEKSGDAEGVIQLSHKINLIMKSEGPERGVAT